MMTKISVSKRFFYCRNLRVDYQKKKTKEFSLVISFTRGTWPKKNNILLQDFQ